jgi:hypothetical protein
MAARRPADVVISGREAPYLRRWHVIPRNRFFNIYFHEFRRSDDDRALHDHPWLNLSWLLEGNYVEWVPSSVGDLHIRKPRSAGSFVARRPTSLHRIALEKDAAGQEIPVWTLFVTGPKVREWGFACPQGWRHWKEFSAHSTTGDSSVVGKGCD